ncbi:hypothetical protein M3J09_008276 [Ascochyta lentis]
MLSGSRTVIAAPSHGHVWQYNGVIRSC